MGFFDCIYEALSPCAETIFLKPFIFRALDVFELIEAYKGMFGCDSSELRIIFEMCLFGSIMFSSLLHHTEDKALT